MYCQDLNKDKRKGRTGGDKKSKRKKGEASESDSSSSSSTLQRYLGLVEAGKTIGWLELWIALAPHPRIVANARKTI